MHPSQIPLVVKPQSPLVGRPGHPRESGGVLCNQNRMGFQMLEAAVHGLQKLDSPFVLSPGGVALPVDQVADGIHPQPVDVELPQPIEGRRLQKAAHLPPGMHKVAAAPLAAAHGRIGVFVESRPVVVPEGVIIHRKMDRHKIHNHADLVLVALVDKITQFVRRTIPGGRAEKPGALVAPGFIAGVLRQRHQFQIVVTVLLQIRDQLFGYFGVAVPVVRLIGPPHPGTKMNLVDVHGPAQGITPAAHPLVIPKAVIFQRAEDRGGSGAFFAAEAIGVAMVQGFAPFAGDPVFIPHPRLGALHPALPEVAVVDPLHLLFLPVVEITDQSDPLCFRRKGAEHCLAVHLRVRAQIFVSFKLLAGIKPVKIHLYFPLFLDISWFSDYNTSIKTVLLFVHRHFSSLVGKTTLF